MTFQMRAALPRRRSRRWIAFFVVLALLGSVAIVAPVLYNLSIQLRPEQLAEARRRWQDNAPLDYDLECRRQTRRGGEENKRAYRMVVRGGLVRLIVEDGNIVYVDASLDGLAGPRVLALSGNDPPFH
ncbi:MAG: hypothetical protein ACRELF_24090, partial [Gemmataceae bacterium]